MVETYRAERVQFKNGLWGISQAGWGPLPRVGHFQQPDKPYASGYLAAMGKWLEERFLT